MSVLGITEVRDDYGPNSMTARRIEIWFWDRQYRLTIEFAKVADKCKEAGR